ncbi:MAG: response regulator, partial [Bacteroidetes bacterium]|nr:response regulator [Bacteroidota bacterium]
PDGRVLLEQLSEHQAMLPDVIFLDLNMPNISGKECLRELKSDPVLRRLPVVIYSTSGAEKDTNDTYRLGACRYIQKPSNIRGLKKTLEQVLSIDWTQGQPIVDKDNYLIRFSWLEAMLIGGAVLWQRCITELPVHGPALSTGWPKFQPRPQL